jgi:hypothetical protein
MNCNELTNYNAIRVGWVRRPCGWDNDGNGSGEGGDGREKETKVST